ncbi:hypothetical protein ABK040_004777 [Willaertia magna]
MWEEEQGIVVDLGSNSCKCGFYSQDVFGVENYVIPTRISKPIHKSKLVEMACYGPEFYGEDAFGRKSTHYIEEIVNGEQDGLIENWDNFSKFFDYITKKYLRIVGKLEQTTLLLSECTLACKEDRQKKTQLFFETYQVPFFYLANQSVLSLFGSGKVTGIVMDSGECCSYSVPIFEGIALQRAILRLPIAGRTITKRLCEKLLEKYPNNEYLEYSDWGCSCVTSIKEKYSFVKVDENISSTNELVGKYELPDGQIIDIHQEPLECTSILFNPPENLLNNCKIDKHSFSKGIPLMINESINLCDKDISRTFYENIIMSGGTSSIKGLSKRLSNDLLLQTDLQVNVTENLQDINLPFIGGRALSKLSTFKTNMCMSKKEYDEIGVNLVHRKCF